MHVSVTTSVMLQIGTKKLKRIHFLYNNGNRTRVRYKSKSVAYSFGKAIQTVGNYRAHVFEFSLYVQANGTRNISTMNDFTGALQ